jgi:hypothetical protein
MVSMANKKNTIEDALWNRITVTGFCWLYEGWLDGHGYGYTRYEGKSRRAHKLAYEELVGPVPDGLVLDHLCRVRNCVNPDHVQPVTHRINLMRGFTPARANTEKTHCVNGHEFTPENTNFDGIQRYCRACSRDKQKRLNSPERRAYRAMKAREYRARDKALKEAV